MLRVVADTNIFISALLFGGLPGSFLDMAFVGSFVLVISPVLLDGSTKKFALNSKWPPRMPT